MKIWVHGYTLTPTASFLPKRRGALLKVEWALGQIGYSDLHPWPEFGEAPLDGHLEALASMNFTRLAEVSLEFNYIDREFRLLKRNAFLGLILPRSHRLVVDITKVSSSDMAAWEKEGYTHIKVKMGRDMTAESRAFLELAYATNIIWRIDFNGRIPKEQFLDWWKSLDSALKQRIDFIEDPIPGGRLPVDGPWANDWYKIERAQIRVMKPAREGIEDVGPFSRVIFTHGMDHPFAQACAAWTAGKFYAAHPRMKEVCGLADCDSYELDDFSRVWRGIGPRMKPTPGLGFGFDEQLESIKWERLF